MPVDDLALWWPRLITCVIRRVVMHDELLPWWDTVGVHRHPIPTVITPITGVTRVELGAHRSLDLLPGEALYLAPWTWHVEQPPRHGAAVSLGWSFQQGDVNLLLQHGGIWIQVARTRIESTVRPLPKKTAVQRCAMLTRLFATLVRLNPQTMLLPAPLAAMLTAAVRHRTSAIPVRDMLASSGMGTTAAYAWFTAWFGGTPKQYQLQCRMTLARDLLERGWTLDQVRQECGFVSRAAFSRRFRLIHGMPPTNWLAQTPAPKRRGHQHQHLAHPQPPRASPS